MTADDQPTTGLSRVRVHLGIGSNLGDRWANLSHAVDELMALDDGAVASPIYETAPIGGPTEQGPYLNCVVRLHLDRSPMDILVLANDLERKAHRVRDVRFGPRTLDVDVLLIEGFTRDDPVLTVPHPRMWDRAFVLAPLEDLDPDLVPQGWRQRLGADTDEQVIRRVGELVRSPRS